MRHFSEAAVDNDLCAVVAMSSCTFIVQRPVLAAFACRALTTGVSGVACMGSSLVGLVQLHRFFPMASFEDVYFALFLRCLLTSALSPKRREELKASSRPAGLFVLLLRFSV
eukprot:TRINITY_DN60423_c0_g1_i3.p1 TRINITY_DN60423_c0_g1~~TRINITY_DN60423_c0_g1_i3.p1  ORF type:complete len:112 (+),score=8.83 TRINITY_DN60423_c0_g1_i3:239-574(+)